MLLADRLREVATRKDLTLQVNSIASILCAHIGTGAIHNMPDAQKMDCPALFKLHPNLRANGVKASYHPCSCPL
jgi:glutamate-1-semialdehyde aminotransferase